MFYRLSLFSIALGCAAGAFATTASAATTVTVGTCLGASTYTSISQAVTAVPAGSTINVCPGAYPEQIMINKSLNLIGIASGPSQSVVVQAPPGGLVANSAKLRNGLVQAVQILVVKAASVNISNIAVDGSNNAIASCAIDPVGIKYQFSSGTINHVVAKNQALVGAGLIGCQSGEGIIAESVSTMSGSSTVVVTNSSVRGYQKNGIVADGSNTKLTAQFNFVSGQGPTTGAAENGIEFISGAGGLIAGNVVLDNIYSPATAQASGILIYAASGVTVSNNSIGSSQLPIATATDPSLPNPGNLGGTADKTTIISNVISNTAFDGIDACSNSNTISLNLITNAASSGIHLDSTCTGTGKNNKVTGNTINDACAGVLQGATPNTISGNLTFNVQSATAAGDSCVSTRVALLATADSQATTARPSPF